MRTDGASPFARATSLLALIALLVTLLSATLMLVPLQAANGLSLWCVLAGALLNTYVLAPLTVLAMLIAIVHKVRTGQQYRAWRRISISLLMVCVAVVGSIWLAKRMMNAAM